MNIMKTEIINNINDKGQFHGYNEWYFKNKLRLRGKWKNGLDIGYQEYHIINETSYYIR